MKAARQDPPQEQPAARSTAKDEEPRTKEKPKGYRRHRHSARKDDRQWYSANDRQSEPTAGRSETQAKAKGGYYRPPTRRKATNHYNERERGGYSWRKPRENERKVVGEGGGAPRSDLADRLRDNAYDCMVCCDAVRNRDEIWSCDECSTIFHLGCIKKWAGSPAAGQDGHSGWRCPACQHCHAQIPSLYTCFCGKVRNPRYLSRDAGYLCPHSCGEICHKDRPGGCSHKCNLLCHPGRCPPCPVMVSIRCPCGKKLSRVRCSQSTVGSCGDVCGKRLACGQHDCEDTCHSGSCRSCEVKVRQVCHCGKQDRMVSCEYAFTVARDKKFCCEQTCGKILDCGNHTCDRSCHEGPCSSCSLLPSRVNFCPCGKTLLESLLTAPRMSCLDPIPRCEKTCGRSLPCGSTGKPHHTCRERCHYGPCPTCRGKSEVVCRCGKSTKEVACSELKEHEGVRCDRICNKKKSCKRHRCNQRCCTELEHICSLPCGKRLQCGIHQCDEPCHSGHCPRCWQTSFDELTCHCGFEIIYPPVPCGTLPPPCSQLCSRVQSCAHPVNHYCHSEEGCPPCTTLTEKRCVGHHKIVWIPCNVEVVTCGSKCNLPLPCGKHTCSRSCHKPPCLGEGMRCVQPCTEARSCGHPCSLPCHSGSPCPPSPCKAKVKIQCKCGRKVDTVTCRVGARDFGRLESEDLASHMRDLQLGRLVDLNSVASKEKARMLECDEDCAVLQRNKTLAEALNIEEPDSVQISLTAFLLTKARTEPAVVEKIEREMKAAVQKAQKTGQMCRHSYPVMKREHRQIVHELAEVYRCQAQSYDSEPNRNVVVTATKTSSLPPVSLMAAAGNSKSVRVLAPLKSTSRDQDQHADLDDPI